MSDSYIYPAYSSETENGGIIGYSAKPEFICNEQNPIYVIFGDHTRVFNIAKESFSVLDNVKVLKPCIYNERALLFIISAWSKLIPNLGYSRHWKIAKNCEILLPTKNNQIDFEFMESFVAELEAHHVAELEAYHVAELEAYLSAAGLTNYELSEDESSALTEYENTQSFNWREYTIGDLFEKIKTIPLKFKTSELPGVKSEKFNLPALTAGIQNQGLNNYVPRENVTILKDVISISANGANTGATFYQSKEFTVLQDAYAIKWKDEHIKLTEKQYLFLVSCISKTIYGNFAWSNKAGWERIKIQKIYLPIKEDKLNFSLMELFISAVQKLTIKDVVAYTDRKMKAIESVVKTK